eukprot:TRINITY_DN41499_c0_g1_i1.p1 TRINITY_DN41499_c0_g1~~TRINITY_DN41499_c0_g1_i1.p1  ORF type:complete len:333 (+),score=55.16 TRINITY_DN41499_c0_g1_i1:163-1161(+)
MSMFGSLSKRGFHFRRLPRRLRSTLLAACLASLFAMCGSLWIGCGFSAASTRGSLAKVVVTDVDGTLVGSGNILPERNLEAIRLCMERGLPVVIATGKHCGPWLTALLEEVARGEGGAKTASSFTLNAPAVFVQGLLVRDIEGKVVNMNQLPRSTVEACVKVALERDWTLVAYLADNRLVSNKLDENTARIDALGEPKVQVGAFDGEVLKMLFLTSPEGEAAIRQEAEELVGDRASITVAIGGMIEILPQGASKAEGVKVALDLLGMTPGDALALGDGENDLEMIQMVRASGGTSVAMENARPILKEAATHIVGSVGDAGWSDAVRKWALGL